jgi:hypothetical protein
LRKGECNKKGCEYKAMDQKEYSSRETCSYMKEHGNCRFGARCKYLHPNDPKTMTTEMMGRCVHNSRGTGRSANAAEEVSDGNDDDNSRE